MAGTGAGRRIGGLTLVVAAVFGGAYGIGQLSGPIGNQPAAAEEHDGMAEQEGHGAEHTAPVPKGLQVSQDGTSLQVLSSGLAAGTPSDFAFRIVGPDGHAVTKFAETHDRNMHLIVARRDLSGFRHVHPEMAADGTWRVPLTLAGAGDYRVFADFLLPGAEDGLTLGADVPVSGAYTPVPLPAPALTYAVDDYRVTLSGELTPGTTSRLTLTVDRNSVPVTDLQPYLGAYGHLVALRQGDLAYLHVHPEESKRAGPSIVFYAEVPSTGTYRLFLDFRHGDVVRTAEFTVVAGEHGHE
ncbi:hypothetical protein [Actinophytocola oryzae]|uniref:Secreted protein n=1 Tax=Actinophytocola oryzae TaxID=502181 RepID=A0A4R7VUP7_9PSEU|nr:hypothetical protein [Actinophytocola oryzae]TDV53700.1 hypothetical protein CLV71_104168 [Actinophytocola oryzae]